MAIYSSILAWETPRSEEPGRLQSKGSQEADATENVHSLLHAHREKHMISSSWDDDPSQLVGMHLGSDLHTCVRWEVTRKSLPFTFIFFFFFWPHDREYRILVPWPGIEPVPSAVEAWNLNHWTTREVPCIRLCKSIPASQSISQLGLLSTGSSYLLG